MRNIVGQGGYNKSNMIYNIFMISIMITGRIFECGRRVMAGRGAGTKHIPILLVDKNADLRQIEKKPESIQKGKH